MRTVLALDRVVRGHVPAPVGQARFAAFRDGEMRDVSGHISARLDRSIRPSDIGCACKSGRGAQTHPQCTTLAKMVRQAVHVRVTQRARRDAMRIVNSGFWCTSRWSLRRRLIEAICVTRNSTAPFVLESLAGFRKEGHDSHRLDHPRSEDGGTQNANVTVSTHVFPETEAFRALAARSPWR